MRADRVDSGGRHRGLFDVRSGGGGELRDNSAGQWSSNVRAQVEPDADGDEFGDETQDACPGLAGGTSGCPPETSLTKSPKKKTRKKTATFEFNSTTPGVSFECRLDGAPFVPCTSPVTEKVKKGKHSFEVRAKDSEGFVDPSAVEATWKVKKRKRN